MKVIHIASLSSSINNIGVVHQMEFERRAAADLGLNWRLMLLSSDRILGYSFQKQFPKKFNFHFGRRWFLFRLLLRFSNSYDVIILRYTPLDPFFLLFRLCNRSAKLLTVHHTKEDLALRIQYKGFKGVIMSAIESALIKLPFSGIDGLVGVTGDIVQHHLGKKKYALANTVYPNGIDINSIKEAAAKTDYSLLEILFVASTFFDWHGLKLVLMELEFSPLRKNVLIHLVGRILEEDLLSIKRLKGSSIKIHGTLSEKDIFILAGKCDIALGSFDLISKGLTEACTLKVRQYLALGLPVYSGHIDSGIGNSLKFYRVGEFRLEYVLSFAEECKLFSRHDVRSLSQPYIDKKILLKKFSDWVVKLAKK